ncbi:hypothetical protein LTR35_008866 [Friedmanniomyces endolithicus]|uniref:Citrate transporter-like domain-containing protein n=1 Tax=Friedmanniomyces endolithicus TaxID=329885 RepID=A0AAN6J806_9PEZI|nr:hypothetical protein LTR35_008866 [Friedmanniomyces endolithicus]KAK0294949.1 hypothetical protein LTS00_006415 [Friedmanniomyces endolithicus]KAK0319803.1 hypothetical protein LTR82_009138 [Friedmanniomyces endolithicus]KAK0985026.1 hypothetical protein LTR54_013826 [Friedmanniomyces endolithicus]
MADTVDELDTSVIKTWRSIVTLIVFVLTNIVVLFPFHIPLWVPRFCADAYSDALSALRIMPPPRSREHDYRRRFAAKPWKRLNFPMNFITAPLIADLFLLAISAIGRTEVHDGTVGSNNIFPIDIMVFFITLAYIAISIDASGLIRYLAFKVLQKGGNNGHRLYIYLYVFFFALTAFIGNDPVILSGTAFLAYMTRISRNIKDPKAWIFAQFSVANVGSAILVSSNPTNLVLTGAFNIKFIHYTANVIVPVLVSLSPYVDIALCGPQISTIFSQLYFTWDTKADSKILFQATVIVLGPFLLFIVFADNDLIPASIELHELDEAARNRAPVNPNIPHARGTADEIELADNSDEANNLSLEEIMNPFLDKGGAAFGAMIMAATLITILALNAATDTTKEHPVFWVTLPAAFIMFCWDVSFGWLNREKTREIARNGRREVEEARAKRAIEVEEKARLATLEQGSAADTAPGLKSEVPSSNDYAPTSGLTGSPTSERLAEKEPVVLRTDSAQDRQDDRPTLASLFAESHQWCQETFPTVTAVLVHLPWALVPFALAMFVLVQALATKGWIPVFAHGWDHWVNKTGVVGAIGGMGFLSVIMCNFAGTNIGTTILLCRVVQVWIKLHERSGIPITQRTFWATVYSMAIGVNYGAFSTAFSASLAGLLWRDILTRKYIPVRSSTFAQVNLKIIAVAMAVGCAVLVGEMYITRSGTDAYQPS